MRSVVSVIARDHYLAIFEDPVPVKMGPQWGRRE
jgi:hypothetical protein